MDSFNAKYDYASTNSVCLYIYTFFGEKLLSINTWIKSIKRYMYLKLFMILDLFSVTFFQEMVAFTQEQITLKCQPEEGKGVHHMETSTH